MTPRKTALESYKNKRTIARSGEPKAALPKAHKNHIFVVQEHHASHLHWDFRLEVNGVLVSWAVPKGPPLELGIKRLAVRTEDHPFAYATFHGVIPPGEYGAGTVALWDKGTYTNLKKLSMHDCVEEGQVAIKLKGKKLNGNYALIQTKFRGKDTWIFIKMHDQDEEEH